MVWISIQRAEHSKTKEILLSLAVKPILKP